MTEAEAREKRRAEALRANLRRRKAKGREPGGELPPAGETVAPNDPSLPPPPRDPR